MKTGLPTNSAGLRTLVIVPCYNEEASVGKVLQQIESLDVGLETMVIDDGSLDDTHAVARRRSRCLRMLRNLGIGGAVQAGIRYAAQEGFDLCLQVDGDGQHLPEEIPLLLQSYVDEPADLIIGSRFLMPGTFASTFLRRLGIGLISAALFVLFRKTLTDPTSGFRLMGRQAIDLFAGEYPHDFPEPISNAVALAHGLTVREVPVRMQPRQGGRSSIRGLKNAAYIIRVIGYLILARLRGRSTCTP